MSTREQQQLWTVCMSLSLCMCVCVCVCVDSVAVAVMEIVFLHFCATHFISTHSLTHIQTHNLQRWQPQQTATAAEEEEKWCNNCVVRVRLYLLGVHFCCCCCCCSCCVCEGAEMISSQSQAQRQQQHQQRIRSHIYWKCHIRHCFGSTCLSLTATAVVVVVVAVV